MQCENNMKLVRNAKISHFLEGPGHPEVMVGSAGEGKFW